jgi:hypothetical protein
MRAGTLTGRATNVTADQEGCALGGVELGNDGQCIQRRNRSTDRQGMHHGLNGPDLTRARRNGCQRDRAVKSPKAWPGKQKALSGHRVSMQA